MKHCLIAFACMCYSFVNSQTPDVQLIEKKGMTEVIFFAKNNTDKDQILNFSITGDGFYGVGQGQNKINEVIAVGETKEIIILKAIGLRRATYKYSYSTEELRNRIVVSTNSYKRYYRHDDIGPQVQTLEAP